MSLQQCGLNLNRDRRELKPHGTLDFPCAAYFPNCTDVLCDEFPWHWHDEMEFIYLIKGTLNLQVPGKSMKVSAGESVFINSKVLHTGTSEDFCEKLSLVFHPELMGDEASVFSQKYVTPLRQLQSLDCCLFPPDQQWMSEINENLLYIFASMKEEKIGYEFEVRECLSRICFTLYRQFLPEREDPLAKPDQDQLRIRKMLAFIHEHFSENLVLSDIASSVNIGERECLRCFRRVIQISPMQYLLKYRVMQGASMLLRNGTDSITDIARYCGFENPSYFTLMFRRYFKTTPREYRKSSENALQESQTVT